jgi:TIR domain
MSITIFFCYARKDEALLIELKHHLRSLQWDGLIEIWYDRDISAGTEWEKEISTYLNTAQIVLLLVSPDFMNSDYCCSVEMKRAVERHEQKEARVIPVILEHVFWQIDPLNKLQALPTDAKPVMSRSWHNMNEALFNITEGIRKVVKELTAQDPSLLPIGTEEAQQQVAQTSLILPIAEPVRAVPPQFFEYQEDAYHSLIRMVQDHGAKEAVLLQYSCHTSLPILRMLLRKGAKVTVFIQHEETVSPEKGQLRSQLQADLIGDTTRNLRSNLGRMLVEPGKLEVYKYRVQSSMSAIKIDNQILCMGWYTFEQKRRGDDKANPDDTIDVSGHDRAAVVVYKGTNEFQALDQTFSILEKNYRKHAEIVPI